MDLDFKLAGAVAIIYFLFKFLEMRLILKKTSHQGASTRHDANFY